MVDTSPADTLRAVGARVQSLRVAADWSQRELARRATLEGFGLTHSTVGSLERGGNASISALLAVAAALRVQAAHLLGEDTGPVPAPLRLLVDHAERLPAEDLQLVDQLAARLDPEISSNRQESEPGLSRTAPPAPSADAAAGADFASFRRLFAPAVLEEVGDAELRRIYAAFASAPDSDDAHEANDVPDEQIANSSPDSGVG